MGNRRRQQLLARARRDGVLRALARGDEAAYREWGRWCWGMKIPVVCWLRASPCARYGDLVLDMCTTSNLLSIEGQAALRKLLARAAPKGHGSFSSVGGRWDRVREGDRIFREVYRIAATLGYYEPDMRLLGNRRNIFGKSLGLPMPIRRNRVASA